MPGHIGIIDDIFIEKNTPYLVSVSKNLSGRDGAIRIWNIITKERENKIVNPEGYQSIVLSSDGAGVLFKYPDGKTRAYSVRKKKKWIEHSKIFDLLLMNRSKLKIK